MIELIAAAARTGVIGAENKLLWRIPEDFAFFKKTTMGSPVVMGSRTWASIGRALPGRLNVIVSRRLQPAAISAKNVEALSLAQARSRTGRVFVIGGGEIYRRTIAIADRVWLTKIDHDFEGDTYFPTIPRGRFRGECFRTLLPSAKRPWRVLDETFRRLTPSQKRCPQRARQCKCVSELFAESL